MEDKVSELLFILAIVSLANWGIVGITAILRTIARLWYQRPARPQLRPQTEKAAE